MTSLTLHRPWTSPTLRNAMVVRQGIAWADYIDAIALILRPLVVTLGIARPPCCGPRTHMPTWRAIRAPAR